MARFPASSVTPLRAGGQTIIMPARAPVAPIVVCPECPDPGTGVPPIANWLDLNEVEGFVENGFNRVVIDGNVWSSFVSGEPGFSFSWDFEIAADMLCSIQMIDPSIEDLPDYVVEFYIVDSTNGTVQYFVGGLVEGAVSDPFLFVVRGGRNHSLQGYQVIGGMPGEISFRVKAIPLP